MEKLRGYLACGLWVLATVLMVFGSFNSLRPPTPLLGWGLFVGLWASVLSVWLLVDRLRPDDVSVERIIEVVDALHEAKHSVSQLH